MGGGADKKGAGSGGQNRSMITPCGMYMNPSRTGGLYAVPLGPSAKPIVSRSGNPSATPRPRRQVRRLIKALLRMGLVSRIGEATMCERIAGDDPHDERLHAVAVVGDRAGKLIDHHLVVALQLPAQRVGKQFAGQIVTEVIDPGSNDSLELLRRAEPQLARQLAGGVDRTAGVVEVAPAADRVEVLQPEPDRVEHIVTIRADGIGPVHFGALAQGQGGGLVALLFQGWHVGRRWWDVLAEHLFQHPQAAVHGAGAVRKGTGRED